MQVSARSYHLTLTLILSSFMDGPRVERALFCITNPKVDFIQFSFTLARTARAANVNIYSTSLLTPLCLL